MGHGCTRSRVLSCGSTLRSLPPQAPELQAALALLQALWNRDYEVRHLPYMRTENHVARVASASVERSASDTMTQALVPVQPAGESSSDPTSIHSRSG